MSYLDTIEDVQTTNNQTYQDQIPAKQFNILDFQPDPNLQLIQVYEMQQQLYEQTVLSVQVIEIVNPILSSISKKVFSICQQKEIDSKIPFIQIQWIQFLVQELVYVEQINDCQEINIKEDIEPPTTNLNENWARFKITKKSIPISKSVPPQPQSQFPSSRSIIYSISKSKKMIQDLTQSRKTIFGSQNQEETKFIELDSLKNQQPIDPYEENLRSKYEVESLLQEQARRLEQERLREKQEQQKSIRGLNLHEKGKEKLFTFDYKGKLIIQTKPKLQNLPSPYKMLNYTNSNQEVLQTLTYLALLLYYLQDKNKNVSLHLPRRKKNKTRTMIKNQNILEHYPQETQSQTKVQLITKQTNGFKFHFQPNNYVQKGPKNTNPYEQMSELDVSKELQNPNQSLRLTRMEYQSIISKGTPSAYVINSQIHNVLDNTKKQNSVTNDYEGQSPKRQREGSILVFNKRVASEELKNTKDSQIEETSQNIIKKKSKQENLNVNDQFALKILESSDWGLNKRRSPIESKGIKIPQQKLMPLVGSLPQLARQPRERGKIIERKRLNPPKIGNTLGHNLEGIRLL